MASLRDIKNKIGAVKKTKQITKAMNMVASAKLRNAQARIERFRPYADKFYEMLGDLAGRADASVHPLLEKREEVKTSLIVLITSDRGLAGSFNTNLISTALKLAAVKDREGKTVKFICVGKKGRDAVRKSKFETIAAYADKMNSFDFTLANQFGMEVISGYIGGAYDEVLMVFGKFVSIAKQDPTVLQILPMGAVEETAQAEIQGATQEYIYEPSVEGLLAELLPRFIKVQLYRGLLDTSASEHAARMRSMDNATKNCDDLVSSLTLVYNKARQATITRDLMDIVGGAEALKK
jgi:F-type H+-transporting ATPase subunit gamma